MKYLVSILVIFALAIGSTFMMATVNELYSQTQTVQFQKVEARHLQRIIITRNIETGEITIGVHWIVESSDGKFNKTFHERMTLSQDDKDWLLLFVGRILVKINKWLGFKS